MAALPAFRLWIHSFEVPTGAHTRRRPSCKIDVPRVNCVILLALGTKSQGVLALHGK